MRHDEPWSKGSHASNFSCACVQSCIRACVHVCVLSCMSSAECDQSPYHTLEAEAEHTVHIVCSQLCQLNTCMLIPHSSRLTPHSSRLTPHSSRLTPHLVLTPLSFIPASPINTIRTALLTADHYTTHSRLHSSTNPRHTTNSTSPPTPQSRHDKFDPFAHPTPPHVAPRACACTFRRLD